VKEVKEIATIFICGCIAFVVISVAYIMFDLRKVNINDSGLKPDTEKKPQREIKIYFPKGFLVLIIVCVVMAVTNPTKQEYITWAKEQAMKQNNPFVSGVVSLLGSPIIDSATTSNNYLFFTIFTTEINNNNGSVMGLFHHFIPL
jgi:hypothetical protein